MAAAVDPATAPIYLFIGVYSWQFMTALPWAKPALTSAGYSRPAPRLLRLQLGPGTRPGGAGPGPRQCRSAGNSLAR